MTAKTKFLTTIAFALLTSGCGPAAGAPDPAAYEQEILDWRAGRLERLLAPTGFLNQVGLFWLDEGRHTFGSAPDNDVVFPKNAAARIGTFEVGSDGIRMQVEPGVSVMYGDDPVKEILIEADVSEHPVMVTHGSLAWSAVERDGRQAIRVRDFEHPFVRSFGPLSYYPIDPAFRVAATLRRYDVPRTADVGTVIEGLGYHPESPGMVAFEIAGRTYELEAYASGDRLFYVFGDETNRDETYGAGRFLYSEIPGEDGRLILDFNKSYSPPCAFNDFSTCPVASPRNRLPVRIEAGELYDPSLSFSAHEG